MLDIQTLRATISEHPTANTDHVKQTQGLYAGVSLLNQLEPEQPRKWQPLRFELLVSRLMLL